MRIYLDHNATTPLDPLVLEAMLPYLREGFGNASSIHAEGREARKTLEGAREVIASLLGARAAETIVFTSGGTEADNLAIKGVAFALKEKGHHIVTSAVEHPAVLQTLRFLETQGFEVTSVPVDREGSLDLEAFRQALRPETILISIMHANNETGVLFPLEEIGRIAKERGILFHTDAVQSFGKVPVNVETLQVDLLSLSAHKLYGPKGIGALYIRPGVRMVALHHGGHQERNRRGGTENVAFAVGFAKAAELASSRMADEERRLRHLRDRLEAGILARIEGVRVNGRSAPRLANTSSLAFEGVDTESLLIGLDLEGIAASSGSACSSGSFEPSHVLAAMGVPKGWGALRLSLGKGNTEEEVNRVLDILPSLVERLRAASRFELVEVPS